MPSACRKHSQLREERRGDRTLPSEVEIGLATERHRAVALHDLADSVAWLNTPHRSTIQHPKVGVR